MHVTKYLS